MIRRSRLLVLLMVITTLGLAWPADVAAQRRAPSGRTVGTAVPRTYSGGSYRGSYPRNYGHYPRYYGYYPRYYSYYPRYYYSPFYYPYYSSFSFGFGVGFGYGYGWPGYWGGYPYAYPYSYGYAYPAYSYYDGGSARLLISPRNAQVYADGQFVGVVDNFDGSFERLRVPLGEHQIEVYLDGYRSYTQKVLFTPGTTIKIAHDMQPLAPGEAQSAKPAPDPATTRAPERYQGPEYQRPEYQRPEYQRPEYQRPERPEQPADPRGEQQAGFGTLAIRVNPPDAEVLIDGEAWERPAGESRLSIELAAGPHQVEIRKAGYRPYVRTIDVLGGRTFTLNVSLPQGGPSMLQINSRR